jgi:hypothetical protein
MSEPTMEDLRREFALAEEEYLDMISAAPGAWHIGRPLSSEALDAAAWIETTRRRFREVKSRVAAIEARSDTR